MTVRLGMTTLIDKLRSLTNTIQSDVTVDDVTYWTDQQLQDILDRHSKMVRDVPLLPNAQVDNGITSFKEFYIPKIVGTYFETADTPGQFALFNSFFVLVSASLYTVDYNIGLITFSSDFGSTVLYLRARVFDINAAAVHVWTEKAAHRAELINWSSGSQHLNEDQEYQHCLEMIKLYQSKAGLKSTRQYRIDYGSSWQN